MNGAAQAMKFWIERELALDGVLAAGGGLVGQPAFAAFATGELILAHQDDVWEVLAETLARLHVTGGAANELLWGFEHAVLCTVQRPDGAWLGVFTVPKLHDESALALRAKLDEFKELNFAS